MNCGRVSEVHEQRLRAKDGIYELPASSDAGASLARTYELLYPVHHASKVPGEAGVNPAPQTVMPPSPASVP